MNLDLVTGVLLAAGGSTRLGTPKQLLPYRDSTLLGVTVGAAREMGFGRLIVTLGHDAQAVREAVDLDGVDVVTVEDPGTGCSASLRSALLRVDPDADGIVLMLGDQPGLTAPCVARLVDRARGPIAVCRYSDGVGHPLWLSRSVFGELAELRGDKGVWRLVQSGRHTVTEVDVGGTAPLDVDTWDDYRRLLAVGRG